MQKRLGGAYLIKIEFVKPDPDQPRKTIDPAKQGQLVDSIRLHGIIQPITVRFMPEQEAYYVITGERRYRAAIEVGLSELPCWVQRPEERDVLARQIVENWQRADLHPFELADALAQLRDTNGYTQAELARATGKPESEISRLLSLLKLPPDVQKEARDDVSGEVTRRHLVAVASANPAAQQQVYRIVKERGLSALETEQFVKDQKSQGVRVDKRGVHRAERVRFKTEDAVVLITFRRRKIGQKDILAALDEARAQAKK